MNTKFTIDDPARKWQHATLEVELPEGWELNYNWGRFHSLVDVHFEGGFNDIPEKIVVGLRRLKEKANDNQETH